MRRSLRYWNKKRMTPLGGSREFKEAVAARREAERKQIEDINLNTNSNDTKESN